MKTVNYNDRKLRKNLYQVEHTLKNILKFAELNHEDWMKVYNAYEIISGLERNVYLKIFSIDKNVSMENLLE